METPSIGKRKGGRRSAAANASTPAAASTKEAPAPAEESPAATPATTPASEKPTKKYSKKILVQPVINENVGRGKRTPKPNPRYMDEAVASTAKAPVKEESVDSEGIEEGEEILSSDEYHGQTDGSVKKRKVSPKSLPIKINSLKKVTSSAARVSNAVKKGSASVPGKRKYPEIDINIDDERGKQLFLDAKRRLTHSPLNSDDEFDNKIQQKGKADSKPNALAAKLLAKFGDMPIKKNNNVRTTANRAGNATRTVKAKASDKQTSNKKSLEEADDLEDFEQMPTFTIVNINDIMDQKGEKKKSRKDDSNEQVDDDEGKRSSFSDTETPNKGASKRKTQHTKILSDDKVVKPEKRSTPAAQPVNKARSQMVSKMYPVKTPSPKTFQTTAQLTKINNNGRFRDGMSNKPAILRAPPPRILNSTLCKPSNQKTVPSLITKLVPKANTRDKQNNNTVLARSKENNVTSYTYTEKDGKLIPKKYPAIQQRPNPLPFARSATTLSSSQRILGQSPGQKLIKKITCFETWYVIKTAEEVKRREIPKITMSLLDLGNNIGRVALPSEDWDYKIVLEKLPNNVILKRGAELAEKKAAEENESKANSSKTKAENKKSTRKAGSAKYEAESTDSTTEEAEANTSTDDVEASSSTTDSKAAGSKESESADEDAIKRADSTDSIQPDSSTAGSSVADEEIKSDVYIGEVQNANIDPNARHNYKPSLITFRRKKQGLRNQSQFDRSVIFKNSSFLMNVDGRNVKLLSAPSAVNHYDDIEILLQIINDISIKSPCVEVATYSL